MAVDFVFNNPGYSPPPGSACDFDGALLQGNEWAGQATLVFATPTPELLLIPWEGVPGALDFSTSAELSDSFLLGNTEARLTFSANAGLAPSWYIRQPLVGGTSGGAFGGVGMGWSPQQRFDNHITAPHTDAPKKEQKANVGWAVPTITEAATNSAWAQIPKLEREGSYPWQTLQHRPESDAGMPYTAPPPKDDGLDVAWDDSIDPRDPATGMDYTAPPPKQLEDMVLPWGELDEISTSIETPYTAPPPKDVEKPIISGPYWYPRWCIYRYEAPHGLELVFNFSSADIPFTAPAGDALIFDADSSDWEQICYDGTYNGPKDAYWYQPHEWEIPDPNIRSFYIVMNTVTLTRVADSVPIPIESMSIGTDMDSWCWSLSANLRRKVDLDLVRPSGGAPVEVEANINGNVFRFVVESYGDDRAYGKYAYSIQGRSVGALLAAPYSAPQSILHSSQLTAAQIVTAALEYTGFTQDWQLTDWLVPGNTYSVTNKTTMQQLLTVAQAAGGVVHTHPSTKTVSLLPWYKHMPWEWGAVGVDATLPTFKTRNTSYQAQPQYNGIYTSGQSAGVTCFVRRSGTDGSNQPQMVTDPLITATEAGLQRGKRILADSGPRSVENITAPLLDDPGMLTPGMLIDVVDGPTTWRGQVTSTQLNAQRPTVTQSLSVLRYHGT